MPMHYLLLLLEFSELCLRSSCNRQDIELVIDKLHQLIPFTNASIWVYDTDKFEFRTRDQFINFGFSEQWIDTYFSKALFNRDPILHRARKSSVAFSWNETFQTYTNVSMEYMREFRRHQSLTDGISCSCSNTHSKGAAIVSVALDGPETAPEHLTLMEFITPHIHEIFNRTGDLNRDLLLAPRLSPREREVIKWVRDGKSTWAIGQILSISESTVKFHVSNVVKKLGASNRPQAIARALQYGIIDL